MTSGPKLTICIATYNRADFLAQALESILGQANEDIEVVVCDNASTDNTADVVSSAKLRSHCVKYFRQESNVGLDRNYDVAVQMAQGEYCWLFSDDDVIKPHAVERVLQALTNDPSLVLVNVEYRSFDLSRVLRPRGMKIVNDTIYAGHDFDRVIRDLAVTWNYIGIVVVRRELWLSRDRAQYYGSLFIHVGVIFGQAVPGAILAIAEPLVVYRVGNASSFSREYNDTFIGKMPVVIESLAISSATKLSIRGARPWSNLRWLVYYRARGLYSRTEYDRWIRPRLSRPLHRVVPLCIAMFPGLVLNSLAMVYCRVRGDWLFLQLMRESRFNVRNLRILNRSS
jgi:abequosyltransferase